MSPEDRVKEPGWFTGGGGGEKMGELALINEPMSDQMRVCVCVCVCVCVELWVAENAPSAA